ncbi:uncharacterized protein [Littorina saxatilis]|uniref:Uncharacterized protein n=1 Tax=Littorina saxatilis TaxID=31220 RepID=A0AAN9BIT6_9CAEN
MVNILSALYVAGFERVFLHLEGEEPRGRWWEEVKKERNVTVMKAVRPSSVFQTKVDVVQHVSDVLRYITVYKYGGAYQDFDVIWATRLPDSLLAYPTVAGMEWVQEDKGWPESFNLGVILARPRAQWLRHYIETHTDFRDNDWGFNSLRMSYKTYELYPHQLQLDRKLQVICCAGTCHPAWEKPDYRRNGISDKRPTMPFSWQEVRAVHVTCPKPHPSLTSPNAVKIGKDMFVEIGRNVLIKSGRQHLIS